MTAQNVQIDPSAEIGSGCELGHNLIVLAGVRIGPKAQDITLEENRLEGNAERDIQGGS